MALVDRVLELLPDSPLASVALILTAALLGFYLIPYFADPHGLRRYPAPFPAAYTNLWLAYQARNGRRYEAVHEAHRKYGKWVRIAPNHLSVADPDAIQPVLGHGQGTLKPDFYDAFVSIARGLFNTRDRADHTRKRRIVSATFAPKSITAFEPYIADCVQRLLVRWDEMCATGAGSDGSGMKNGKEWKWFDCLEPFNWLAFDIIGDLAFGSPFGMIEAGADVARIVHPEDGRTEYLPAVQILNERGEYSATQGVLPPYIRPYTRFIDPWFGRGLTSVKRLAGIAVARVNDRFENNSGSDREDLLAKLSNGKDENGEPMGREELTAEALTQLIAGSDTTSNSSCAITYHVVNNPSVHARLVKELDDNLDEEKLKEHDGVAMFDMVKNLPYLRACIDEALRIHSTSALGLPREVPDGGMAVCGEWFNEGTVLSCPTYTIHHLGTVWGDPEAFRPERWLKAEKDPVQHEKISKAFMPFSFGPRSCVGRNVAEMELLMFIATLFKRYNFVLKEDGQQLATSEGFLRKPLACHIGIRRREKGEKV